MDKSMVKGLVIGAVVATVGGAFASYNMMGGFGPPPPTHADVLNVVPATRAVTVPREVCEDVAVTRQKPVKDQHQVVGTVAGAVIGGVLGSKIGGGSGKKVATVAGAAAGGYAGNKIQERVQAGSTYTEMETRCKTVEEKQDEVIGYDVTYRIGETQGQVRMDHDPGTRIPLVDGELALN